MLTNKGSTYVLLARGDEDVRLLEEIRKVASTLGIASTRSWFEGYPMLAELASGLDKEVNGDE